MKLVAIVPILLGIAALFKVTPFPRSGIIEMGFVEWNHFHSTIVMKRLKLVENFDDVGTRFKVFETFVILSHAVSLLLWYVECEGSAILAILTYFDLDIPAGIFCSDLQKQIFCDHLAALIVKR